KYGKHISELESILKGKQRLEDFRQKLENQMKDASLHQHYEMAKEIHDTIQRLQNLQTRQKMESTKNHDEEYFGIAIQDKTAHLMSSSKQNGEIRDRPRFPFDTIGDNQFSSFFSHH